MPPLQSREQSLSTNQCSSLGGRPVSITLRDHRTPIYRTLSSENWVKNPEVEVDIAIVLEKKSPLTLLHPPPPSPARNFGCKIGLQKVEGGVPGYSLVLVLFEFLLGVIRDFTE